MANKKLSESARLRQESERLLREQRDLLTHAGSVVRDASRELGRFAGTEAYPRIAGLLGSTLTAVEAVRQSTRKSAGKYIPAVAPAKKGGAGKYVALGFGLAVLIGVGYVLWENFRADDELWVEDE